MAERLAIPDLKIDLPDPPAPQQDGASPEQVAITEAVNKFSKEALENNVKNLSRSILFIDQSFRWLRNAYTAMLVVGLGALIAAVVKGLSTTGGSEVAATAVMGGVSIGALLSALVLKPTESMERDALLVPWMLLVLNTYWTRLVYMNDPKTIDSQLEDAAKDAAAELKEISEVLAKAIGAENERLKTMSGSGNEDTSGEENGKGQNQNPPSKPEPEPGKEPTPQQN